MRHRFVLFLARVFTIILSLGFINLAFTANAFGGDPHEIIIDDSQVLLGDIVVGLPQELASLVIGTAPQPGQTRLLQRAALLRRLQQAKIDTEYITLPSAVRIRRSHRTISEIELRGLIATSLARVLPAPLKAREVALTGGIVVAGGELEVSVRPPKNWVPGRQILYVDISTGQSCKRQLVATVDIVGKSPEPEILILRGKEIRIMVQGHGLLLQTSGVAQQTGRLGELIAVLPHNGQKMIKGKVRDSQIVEVMP